MDNVKDNEMHYYDLQCNWTLKIVPHLNNATFIPKFFPQLVP
jgi:hypothetical protein